MVWGALGLDFMTILALQWNNCWDETLFFESMVQRVDTTGLWVVVNDLGAHLKNNHTCNVHNHNILKEGPTFTPSFVGASS